MHEYSQVRRGRVFLMGKFSSGENLQNQWRNMDSPPRVGSCKKLRQGQFLMQRYKYVWDTHNHSEYLQQAIKCKDKSVILAKRMVDHVEGCVTCQSERVLEEVHFYGVY